jgi:hypothetical protein
MQPWNPPGLTQEHGPELAGTDQPHPEWATLLGAFCQSFHQFTLHHDSFCFLID